LLVRPEAFAPCGEGDGFAVEVVSTVFHAGRISLTAATDTGDIISADLDDAVAGHLVPGAKIRLRAVRARLIAA
jgi:hypothetical protein